MIRLEGSTLPTESQGAVPPILIGDRLLDVPGIPLQIGWAATLANRCGVEETDAELRLADPDLATILAAVPPSGVVQLDQEWIKYKAVRADPWRLVVASGGRGWAETVPATHDAGTTVYFVETRPIYAFAYVPPGCTYGGVDQVRVNDQAETPPVTIRLQDDRIVPGVRLITAEFDASKGFLQVPPATTPAALVVSDADRARARASANLMGAGAVGLALVRARTPLVRSFTRTNPLGMAPFGPGGRSTLDPPRPALPSGPPSATTPRGLAPVQTIRIRQGPLGRVSADLRGLLDTPGGRYTGTGSAPVVLPAHVVRLFLDETYGETRLHARSFATTAARQSARRLTWRLVWTGDAFESFRTLAQDCGHADLWLDEAGDVHYAFRDPSAAVDVTLTERELASDPGVGWTTGRDVITVLEVTWGSGLQSGSFTLDSPAMARRHGRNTGSLALPWAATEAVARVLARDALARRHRPRIMLSVAPVHAALGLTLRDRVVVRTPLLDLYGSGRVPYDVVGVTDRGDQRVLALLEGDPLARALMLSGTLAELGAVALDLSGSLEGLPPGLLALDLSGTLVVPGSLSVPLSGSLVHVVAVSVPLTGTIVLPGSLSVPLSGTLETVTPPPVVWDGADDVWDRAGDVWDATPPATPPVLDATASKQCAVAASDSLSITIGSAADRSCFVVMTVDRTVSVSSATFDGVALGTPLLTALIASTAYLYVWHVVNPGTGSKTIAVTLDQAARWTLHAVSFSNVDQTTPLGTGVLVNPATIGTSASVTVSSDEGDLVFSACMVTGDGSAYIPTGTSGTTTRTTQQNPGNVGVTSTGTTAGSVGGASYAWSGGIHWGIWGVPLHGK